MDQPQLTPCQEVRQQWLDGDMVLRRYKDAHTSELDFCLKLEHYRDADNDESNDRRRIKPRTADLYNIVRHKSAEISRSEIYLDVRPRPEAGLDSPMDDQRVQQIQMGAKVAKIALESTIHHPRYGYEEARDRIVLAGLAGRIGCVCVEWDPRKRPYGEMVFRVVDFRNMAWTAGTYGPHDPACWWVIERKRMTREQIRAMKKLKWKNTEKATESAGPDTAQGNDPSLPPGTVRLAQGGSVAPNPSKREEYVNVLFRWIIEDETTAKSPEEHEEMDPADYYLACPKCGYEEKASENGMELPTSAPCPVCAQENPTDPGTMQRVEMRARSTESLAYPEGRLTIVPEDGSDVTFYDGPPDCPTRAFRHMTFEPYLHPYEPIGLSDTKLHKNMQLILDSTYRLGYEQMSENRHLIVTLEDGLTDANGEPWQFSDAQGRVAYARDHATLQGIRDFQGQAVPQGWSEFLSQLRAAFIPNFGISDVRVEPGNTQNIPVGTMEKMQQSGELPVQHHITRLQRRESILFGVVLDMIRHYWTERRWIDYMGPEGSIDYKLIQGTSLPDANVSVTASPSLQKIEQDQAQALEIVFSKFRESPAIGKAMAKALGVPPDQIAELQKELEGEQINAVLQKVAQMLLQAGMPQPQVMMLMQQVQMEAQQGPSKPAAMAAA